MSAVRKFLLSFAVFVVVCGLGLKWYVNYEVGRELRRGVSDVDGLSLSWDDLSVSILHPSVTLTTVAGVLPSGEHFTADRVRITAFDQRNPVPYYANVEAGGVRFDAVPGVHLWWPGLAATLEGPDNPCDLALDYAYNPDRRTLAIKTARLASPVFGRLALSATLSGIDLADHRAEQLIGLRLVRADLHFAEGSLLDSLLGNVSASLTPGQAREQLCAELDARADAAARDDNPDAEKVLRGLSRYVRRPGSLTVTARPAEPVPLSYVFLGRDLYDNIRLLGLTVTADDDGSINQ